MRIFVTVEVSNRLLPSFSITKRKPEKSYLSIGYPSKLKDCIFILHQTLNNSVGTKYKVSNNIVCVFDKYIDEGKATIRLKEPPVDLIMKGEPNKIKSFLKIVNCCFRNKDIKMRNLSNLLNAPTKVVSEPTVHLAVKDKKPLPPFPRTIQHLQLNQCCLKKFDCRILRLQQLKVLDLEGNEIEEIPEEIDLLPALEVLILSKNKLGRKTNYAWLNSSTLRSNLTHLDLRENELKVAPREIVHLKKLKILLLDRNNISQLPKAFGLSFNLKKLGLSENKLKALPSSFHLLKSHIETIDLSCNPWESSVSKKSRDHKFPSLVELAGLVVLDNRIYFSEEIIPRTLVYFLEDEVNYTMCLKPTYCETLKTIKITQCFPRGCNYAYIMGYVPEILTAPCVASSHFRKSCYGLS